MSALLWLSLAQSSMPCFGASWTPYNDNSCDIADDLMIYVTRSQLSQILINLLSNARDATQEEKYDSQTILDYHPGFAFLRLSRKRQNMEYSSPLKTTVTVLIPIRRSPSLRLLYDQSSWRRDRAWPLNHSKTHEGPFRRYQSKRF